MRLSQHAVDPFEFPPEMLRRLGAPPSLKPLPQESRDKTQDDRRGSSDHAGQRAVAPDELAESVHRPDRPRRHGLAIEKPAKVQGEGVRTLVSPLRLLFETTADDRLEIRRHRPVEPAQGHRVVGHDLDQRLHSRGTGEGRPSGNQIVEGGADRVDISTAVDSPGVALDLFRRHVGGRPHHGSRNGHRGPAGVACNPEIEDIGVDRAVLADVDHDVARFEVAVDHPVGVRRLSRLCNLLDDLHLVLERQPEREFFQRSALDELHGDVGPALDLADVIDPAHVIVLDPALGPGLALESIHLVGVVGPQELEGDRPAQTAVNRQVDAPHGAFAEEGGDAEPLPVGHRIFEDQLFGAGPGRPTVLPHRSARVCRRELINIGFPPIHPEFSLTRFLAAKL